VRKQMKLPDDAQFTVGKVRKDGGKVGGRAALPDHLRAKLTQCWTDIVAAKHAGLTDFVAMRAAHPL